MKTLFALAAFATLLPLHASAATPPIPGLIVYCPADDTSYTFRDSYTSVDAAGDKTKLIPTNMGNIFQVELNGDAANAKRCYYSARITTGEAID